MGLARGIFVCFKSQEPRTNKKEVKKQGTEPFFCLFICGLWGLCVGCGHGALVHLGISSWLWGLLLQLPLMPPLYLYMVCLCGHLFSSNGHLFLIPPPNKHFVLLRWDLHFFGYNCPAPSTARSPVIENGPIVDQNCDLGRFKL
jgi:hypothetical protein